MKKFAISKSASCVLTTFVVVNHICSEVVEGELIH